MKSKDNKPQLHQSHMAQLFRCGEKFKRKYLLGHREKTSTALIQGSASHAVAEEILRYKVNNDGELPHSDEVREMASSHYESLWNTSDLQLKKDEIALGLDKVKAIGTSMAENLANKYLSTFAKLIVPEDENAIEKKWVVECQNYPYDLSGQFDVVEKYIQDGKEIRTIRDLKNLSKDPGQITADSSEQFSFYALAYYVIYGVIPDEIYMDVLIKRKDGSSDSVGYVTCRNQEDLQSCFLRFERACDVISKESFPPASRADWWCSENFCGFAMDGSCPFFNKTTVYLNDNVNKRTVANQKKNKEKKNGESKKNSAE